MLGRRHPWSRADDGNAEGASAACKEDLIERVDLTLGMWGRGGSAVDEGRGQEPRGLLSALEASTSDHSNSYK